MDNTSTIPSILNNTNIICRSSLLSPVLTVIVTIYNSERYLDECVESLMSQTLNTIEYIFIDDASDDGSVEKLQYLLKKYPDREESVTIMQHHHNCGVAKTRQEGLLYARGKWIIFCDSDDRVKPEAYQRMLGKAELVGADIVGCGFLYFGDLGNPKIVLQGNGEIEPLEMLHRVCGISSQTVHGSLCNKLIKADLYKSIVFPPGLSYCEDEVALLQILLKTPKTLFLAEPYYEYRTHAESLVRGKNKHMLKQIEILIPFLNSLMNDKDTDQYKALAVKITTYLYRLLKSKTLSINKLSLRYGMFRKYLSYNRELNFLEKLHLSLALDGKVLCAKVIGQCNEMGYMLIKKIQKLRAYG